MNWTKVGLKVYIILFSQFIVASLNWTKVGLKAVVLD